MTAGHPPRYGHRPFHGKPVNASPPTVVEPRFEYTEYSLSDETVAMIEDVNNEHAWIQSNVTYPVLQ